MNPHPHATIPSLDGLRAVSIAIVFFAHAHVVRGLPGGFGVTVFFFLSGYLITTLFYRERDKTGGIDLRAFYIRRLLRLSPPLFVTLALTYGLVAAGVFEGRLAPGAIASQIFYYYNYYSVYVPGSTEGALGLNVLWSLAVEEHFYLIYPWIFLLLLRDRLNLTHMAWILAGILAWRIFRFTVMGTSANTIYMSTDTRFDSILYGALLAMMAAGGQARRFFPEGAWARSAILLAALAVLLLCFVWRDATFRSTLRYSLQGLALMPVFHYAVTRPDLWYFRPLNWTPLRWIGIYSYTIYLSHTVVLGNLDGIGPGNRLVFALLAGAICVAYAAFIFHFVERPIKALRNRLTAPPTGPAATRPGRFGQNLTGK